MNAEALARALATEGEEGRYRAVRQAGSAGDAETLTALAAALGDASWRVRKAAVEAMVAHPLRGDVLPLLVGAMADPDNAGARNSGAEALIRIGPPAVPSLVGRLTDPDRDLRKFAVDVLGEIGDEGAVPGLVESLHDEDENVRAAAAEALGKIGGEAAGTVLTRALSGSDLLVTVSAAEALSRAGTVVPLEVLQPLLGRRLLRRPLLRLLARLDRTDALDGIVEGLADASRGTRETALAALAEWVDWHDPHRARLTRALAAADPGALEPVCATALDSGDATVIGGAVEVLSALAVSRLAPAMVEVARDEALRERVQRALVRMGPNVLDALLAAMPRLAPSAQQTAVSVLALVGDGRAVPYLVQALDTEDPDVRLAAMDALGTLGDGRAVEALSRHLGRSDRLLADTAIRALAGLAESSREAVLDVCRGLLGHEEAMRVADACRVLAEVGSPAEVPLLQAVLRHVDPRAREAAVEALGLLPGPEAVGHLGFVLADEAPQVRAAAARALGRHGGRAAVEALVAALSDEEPTVVGTAAEALGEVGAPDEARLLLPLVGDERQPGPAPAAYAAVRALARLGAPELPTALYRAAAHPEGEVVKEVARVAADLDGLVGTQVLLACARHPAWDVRRAAARHLALRGDPAVLADLRALLDGEGDPLAAEGFADAIRRLEEP